MKRRRYYLRQIARDEARMNKPRPTDPERRKQSDKDRAVRDAVPRPGRDWFMLVQLRPDLYAGYKP